MILSINNWFWSVTTKLLLSDFWVFWKRLYKKKRKERKKKEKQWVVILFQNTHISLNTLRVSMSIHQCNTHEIIEKITKKLTYCTTEKKITAQTKTVLKTFPFRPLSCHSPHQQKSIKKISQSVTWFRLPTNKTASIGSRVPPPQFGRSKGGSRMSNVACMPTICRKCIFSVACIYQERENAYIRFLRPNLSLGWSQCICFFPCISKGVTWVTVTKLW